MHKYLYKIVLYLVKVIPVLTAGLFFLNTVLSYFNIDLEIFSHIGGVSIFSIMFMYATSVAFRFCLYHRLFIHYIFIFWLLNLYDYYVGIPLNNLQLLYLYLIVTGLFIFGLAYGHNSKRHVRQGLERTY